MCVRVDGTYYSGILADGTEIKIRSKPELSEFDDTKGSGAPPFPFPSLPPFIISLRLPSLPHRPYLPRNSIESRYNGEIKHSLPVDDISCTLHHIAYRVLWFVSSFRPSAVVEQHQILLL
jgi:hypothetical protein